MKKVFIKYNPYKLETEITVDGRTPAGNSKLREKAASGSRLQEWIEELPDILVDEYNDSSFDILFHGTLLDYEDLDEVLAGAYEKKVLTNVKLERKPAKETSDKEVLIDEVFQEIQKGPFEELKDSEILNAFEHAKSSNFEVCVVATMSAGKSTMINSMLQERLMPSKQEACTAIITKIKDNDSDSWSAEVYNKGGRLTETQKSLTYHTMERLNADEEVSEIRVEGNIPFVTSEEVSLVLIDTPGPNNSRDPQHKKVQSEFLGKSSKSLVLYIMEGTFGSDDDNALLHRVADSMDVGGKQSKDRFIFVVNKMDDRRKEDGATKQTLNRVREYLKRHGIENPNLFPAAALPALNIRIIQNKAEEIDEDTLDETELKVRKLNRNEELHFEEYAALPASIKGEIRKQLTEAEENGDAYSQALIHTGIISIETAIRQYVQKYAKTAKIKNVVDTFMHKFEEVGCFEETKRELAGRQDESEKIVRQLNEIRRKVDDVKETQMFENVVEDAVNTVKSESENIIGKIELKYQKMITKNLDKLYGQELKIEEAEEIAADLEKLANNIKPDFEEDLDELVRNNLIQTSAMLLEGYRQKLSALTEEISQDVFSGISIEPVKLMGGSIVSSDSFSIQNFIKEKEVEVGEEYVKNTDKKWYKPWTWFQESGYWRTKYETVKYIPGDEIAETILGPARDEIYEFGEETKRYTVEQSEKIAKVFSSEFERLDTVLKEKLKELESFATDREKAEERIAESERKLEWLGMIRAKVESILEI